MTDFRFAPVEKDPDETLSVELDFYNLCAIFWRPNERYDTGDVFRPGIPTGFAYQASAGTSGAREPTLPRRLGATVLDGSATLTAIDAGTAGLNEISAFLIEADTGISAGAGISELRKLLVDYVGGSEDSEYQVKYTVTINGKPRVARQTVVVVKK